MLEQVNREVPLKELRWGLDHCETLTPQDAGARWRRSAAASASRTACRSTARRSSQKYGAQAAADAPPIARIREMGIPLACGTDANRATSYNPWIGVHWLLTGKTLGGGKLQGDQNLLDRTEALRLYTAGGAWMSSEEDKKGTLEAGKLADLVILSGDYFSMPVDEVKDLESRADHGGRQGGRTPPAPTRALDAPPPPSLPDWLPVRHYGGYHQKRRRRRCRWRLTAIRLIISDCGNWSIECPCGA